MRWLVAAAAAAATGGSTPYAVHYGVIQGRYCTDAPLQVRFIDELAPYACGGTDTVCGSTSGEKLSTCKAACDASEDCIGFQVSDNTAPQPTCSLMPEHCKVPLREGTLAEDPLKDLYVKVDSPHLGGCKVGEAVVAAASVPNPLDSCAIADQFDPVGEFSDHWSAGCATLDWTDGCGWTVFVPPGDPEPVVVVPPVPCAELYSECNDQVAAANFLFGTDDPEICSRTKGWLERGYCTNALFAAVCRETCPVAACEACANTTAAANMLAAMTLGGAAGGDTCSLLAAEVGCDPVVAVVCPAQCPPAASPGLRRLSPGKYKALVTPPPRRLSSTVPLYGTYDPTDSSTCAPVQDIAVATQDDPTWYNLHEWMQPVDVAVSLHCPDVMIYASTPEIYCPDNNVDLDEFPAVKDQTCWNKCNGVGSTDPAYGANFCAGFMESFHASSDALCLPQSECEAQCTSLGAACIGFSMHKSLPLCFLISRVCADPEATSTYDQYVQQYVPGSECYPDVSFTTFATLLPGTARGVYTKSDDDLFVSPDAEYEYVWGPRLGEQCARWVLRPANATEKSLYMSHPNNGTCVTPGPDPVLTALDAMYLVHPPKTYDVAFNYVCDGYGRCGTLHTCVLPRNKFAADYKLQFLAAEGVGAEKAGWLSKLPEDAKASIFDETLFRPKTLISVELAASFIHASKTQFAVDLYRNAPSAPRVKVVDIGSDVVTAVLRLASPLDGHMGVFALPVPISGESPTSFYERVGEHVTTSAVVAPEPGYSGWVTDVLRIERFGANVSEVATSVAKVDFYAPAAPSLVAFVYPADGSAAAVVDAEAVGGGYFRVAIASAAADVVGAVELGCAGLSAAGLIALVPNADPTLTCPPLASRETCEFRCMPGYVAAGSVTCTRSVLSAGGASCEPVETYVVEPQIFLLAARGRMDYGWRIRNVAVFGSEDCTVAVPEASISILSTSYAYLGEYTSEKLFKVQTLTPEVNCGKGRSVCADFWTGLNVNPYPVDETHLTAFVKFSVLANVPVGCVKVTSRSHGPEGARQYFPLSMSLHRGTFDGVVVDEEGWTEAFTKPVVDKSDAGSISTFKVSCGEPGTLHIGEMLAEHAGVASPCHCKQICIDFIDDGCLFWNYDATALKCTLLPNSKGGPRPCNAPDVTWSGDTGPRVLAISPLSVAHGQAFDLRLSGVNLPTTAKKGGTTPDRQRVKLVPEPASPPADPTAFCADAVVPAAVEGLGCSAPLVCRPKPTSTTSKAVVWAGLTVQPSPTQKYMVCYNKGFTDDRYQWFHIGSVPVVGTAAYVYTLDPPGPLKRTLAEFRLTATTVDAFAPPPASWTLKFLRAEAQLGTDCAAAYADALLVGGASSTGKWDVPLYAAAGSAPPGLYKVCVSVDGGAFVQIASSTGAAFLEIVALEADSAHPRQLFEQRLSGRVGETKSFSVPGHRLLFPAEGKLALLTGSKSCVGDFFVTEPTNKTNTTNKSNGTSFVAGVDVDKSSSTEYVFTGTVPAPAGEYTACYCDPQQSAGDGGSGYFYKVQLNARCGDHSLFKTDVATVIASALAVSMSAADIAVIMADTASAAVAFAAGLTAELGVPVTVTSITASRRLSDARGLQALSSVNVDFTTTDLMAFAAIETLSTGSTTSLVSKLTTALADAGISVTISSLTVSAPSLYTPPPPPPCDPDANYTVLNKGLPNETVVDNNACLPGNDTHVIMDGEPIRLRNAGERRLAVSPEVAVDLNADHYSDLCHVKCPGGCSGTKCFCDFYTMALYESVRAVFTDAGSYAQPLCLDALSCAAACDTDPSCTAFDYDPALNFCWLLAEDASCSTTPMEGAEFWVQTVGAPCTTASDFGLFIGTMTVTADAITDIAYVLTPDANSSIEVVGSELSWESDRVLIIDSSGICGLSGPSSDLIFPRTLAQFNHWTAEHDDPRIEAPDVEPTGAPVLSSLPNETRVKKAWDVVPDVYCAGNNIAPSNLGESAMHLCYRKCVAQAPCVGSDCFCDGLVPELDDRASPALCLDLELCKAACDESPDCYGIDMKADKSRCVLNYATCEAEQRRGLLRPDTTYDFYFLYEVPTEETSRALVGRQAPVDPGTSSKDILRFRGLQFTSGGDFKACFCDASLTDGACRKLSNYAVEVGRVYVSGVSCLLSVPSFRRGLCIEQYHGGLRCHANAPDPFVPPPDVPTASPTPAPTPAPSALSTYCLYGPEEETAADPLCF